MWGPRFCIQLSCDAGAAVPLWVWVLEQIGFWPGIPYMTAVSRQEAIWEFDDLMKSAPDTWGQWRGAEKLRSMNWPPRSGPSQCSRLVGGHGACWKGPTWFSLYWEIPSLSPLGWLTSKLVLTISKQHGLGASIFRIRKFNKPIQKGYLFIVTP